MNINLTVEEVDFLLIGLEYIQKKIDAGIVNVPDVVAFRSMDNYKGIERKVRDALAEDKE